MAELLIYGASDDLIEVEGAGLDEEYNLPIGGWEGVLTDPNGGSLVVWLNFGEAGVLDWQIVVQARDAYPSWPLYFTERPGYPGDPAVAFNVPEGTTLTTNAEPEV